MESRFRWQVGKVDRVVLALLGLIRELRSIAGTLGVLRARRDVYLQHGVIDQTILSDSGIVILEIGREVPVSLGWVCTRDGVHGREAPVKATEIGGEDWEA